MLQTTNTFEERNTISATRRCRKMESEKQLMFNRVGEANMQLESCNPPTAISMSSPLTIQRRWPIILAVENTSISAVVSETEWSFWPKPSLIQTRWSRNVSKHRLNRLWRYTISFWGAKQRLWTCRKLGWGEDSMRPLQQEMRQWRWNRRVRWE